MPSCGTVLSCNWSKRLFIIGGPCLAAHSQVDASTVWRHWAGVFYSMAPCVLWLQLTVRLSVVVRRIHSGGRRSTVHTTSTVECLSVLVAQVAEGMIKHLEAVVAGLQGVEGVRITWLACPRADDLWAQTVDRAVGLTASHHHEVDPGAKQGPQHLVVVVWRLGPTALENVMWVGCYLVVGSSSSSSSSSSLSSSV